MGANNSKKSNILRSENNTYIINKTTINSLNKTIQNISSEIVNNVIQSSTSNVDVQNITNMVGVIVESKDTIKFSQDNTSNIKITDELVSEIVAQLQSNISSELINEITNNVDNDILNDIINKTTENIENGFLNTESMNKLLGIGNKSEESNLTELVNNINMNNDITTNLQNIVELVIESSISNNTSQQCMKNVISKNVANFKDSQFYSEEGGFVFTQNNTLTLISTCILNSKIISSITDKLMSITQIKVENDTSNKASNKSSNESSKSVKNQGIGDAAADVAKGIGEGASKIVDSAGNAVSSVFSGMTWIFVVVGVVLIAALIGIVIFLNSSAGQEISKKVIDKGLSKIGGSNDFLYRLIYN